MSRRYLPVRWISTACALVALLVSLQALAADRKNVEYRLLSPAELAQTPSYRYANMTNEEAFAELDRRGISYQRLKRLAGVRAPIRLTAELHGVDFHSTLPPEQRATALLEVLDARLALALDDFAAQLARRDIVEVIHFNLWRANVPEPGTAPEQPQQAAGEAEDQAQSRAKRTEPQGKRSQAKRSQAKRSKPKSTKPKSTKSKRSKPKRSKPKRKRPLSESSPASQQRLAFGGGDLGSKGTLLAKSMPLAGEGLSLKLKRPSKTDKDKDQGKKSANRPSKTDQDKDQDASQQSAKQPSKTEQGSGKKSAKKSAKRRAAKPSKGQTQPAKSEVEQAPAKPKSGKAAGRKAAPRQTTKPTKKDGSPKAQRTSRPDQRSGKRKGRSDTERAQLAEPRSDEQAGDEPAPPPKQIKWAPPGTRHPAGMAIDVGLLRKRDGTLLSVAHDFGGQIGLRTCGPDATPPKDAEAEELWTIVCDTAEAGIFTYTLTPNYDQAHVDHFHMEILKDVRWVMMP